MKFMFKRNLIEKLLFSPSFKVNSTENRPDISVRWHILDSLMHLQCYNVVKILPCFVYGK